MAMIGNATTDMNSDTLVTIDSWTIDRNCGVTSFEISADKNITAAAIDYNAQEDTSSWVTMANASADFTNPNVPVKYASADITGLASDTCALVSLDVEDIYQIRVQGKTRVAASATIYWNATPPRF